MTRLDVISSYIKEDEKVLDVGCDKAHLSRILARRGIYSIASDIHNHIIEEAKSLTNDKLKQYIIFNVCDGVPNIDESEYTLVLAGMGTYTILDIISNSKKDFNKIITISNNNHDILRNKMLKYGYVVSSEEVIKEKNKYYNLIIFIKGYKEYTKEELIVGVNHKNIDLLKEKNNYLIKKYKDILNNKYIEELDDVVKILENYKY